MLHFHTCEYWAGAQAVVAVAAAQESLASILDLGTQLRADLSLIPEVLTPHVTLARKVTQAPVLQAMSPFEWQACSFCLVRSETGGKGAVYTVVDTWPLLDKIPKS
jgi:2'-5' RNA ligase